MKTPKKLVCKRFDIKAHILFCSACFEYLSANGWGETNNRWYHALAKQGLPLDEAISFQLKAGLRCALAEQRQKELENNC